MTTPLQVNPTLSTHLTQWFCSIQWLFYTTTEPSLFFFTILPTCRFPHSSLNYHDFIDRSQSYNYNYFVFLKILIFKI